jgi:hypothetical protein
VTSLQLEHDLVTCILREVEENLFSIRASTMQGSPALVILISITAVASTIWLIACNYLANSPAMAAKRSRNTLDAADTIDSLEPSATRVVGRKEIEGAAAENSRRFAAMLAKEGLWPGGLIQILNRSDHLVSFVVPGNGRGPSGEVRFDPKGNNACMAEYVVDYPGIATVLKIGWIIQAIALLVLAVGFWALRTFVATSSNPAIWGQSFQMIQIVHFIWPPFLMGYLYRVRYRLIRDQIETILVNLAHLS